MCIELIACVCGDDWQLIIALDCWFLVIILFQLPCPLYDRGGPDINHLSARRQNINNLTPLWAAVTQMEQ